MSCERQEQVNSSCLDPPSLPSCKQTTISYTDRQTQANQSLLHRQANQNQFTQTAKPESVYTGKSESVYTDRQTTISLHKDKPQSAYTDRQTTISLHRQANHNQFTHAGKPQSVYTDQPNYVTKTGTLQLHSGKTDRSQSSYKNNQTTVTRPARQTTFSYIGKPQWYSHITTSYIDSQKYHNQLQWHSHHSQLHSHTTNQLYKQPHHNPLHTLQSITWTDTPQLQRQLPQ